jgi:hypothetical protein
MAIAIQGSIQNVVMIFTRKEADIELRPKFDRRAPTPACSRI